MSTLVIDRVLGPTQFLTFTIRRDEIHSERHGDPFRLIEAMICMHAAPLVEGPLA